jgi:hypothetical protein
MIRSGERLGWPRNVEAFLRERAWTEPAMVLAVAAREAAFHSVSVPRNCTQP